jgi:hypothetical protein
MDIGGPTLPPVRGVFVDQSGPAKGRRKGIDHFVVVKALSLQLLRCKSWAVAWQDDLNRPDAPGK